MSVPYAAVLAGRDPKQVIEETPARWTRLLDAMTPEEVEIRPEAGKWNLREIVAHMADCEIAWSWRLRQARSEQHTLLQPFDQTVWGEVYEAYSLAAARSVFLALRAWNVAFVGSLSEADRSRPVTHPSYGEETLWTIVEIMAGHDLHHLEKLEAARA